LLQRFLPITGIAGCWASAASGHAAAEQRDELAPFQLIEAISRVLKV
jgi:hypothetical protein